MLETELFAFLEHTTDAAFAVGEDGQIHFWNKAAEKLLGYSAEDVVHKTCFEVLQGFGALGTRVCQEGCSVMECVGRHAEIPNFDLSVKNRSGQRMWINMSTIVFDNPRTSRRLLVHLAHDISEQKRTEELAHKMLDLSRELGQIGQWTLRPEPASPLSDQEKQILHLFSGGQSSHSIAKTLGISVPTLRNHLHHINQKLRTHNRLEAVMHAIQRKLI
jgi:PAS domain S-box-containing protein